MGPYAYSRESIAEENGEIEDKEIGRPDQGLSAHKKPVGRQIASSPVIWRL
jgi:hypothetical protein